MSKYIPPNLKKETEKEKQQRLVDEEQQKHNERVKEVREKFKQEKDYEYYARFPFDFYERYNDMGLDLTYLPDSWLIDHELSDISNGVYYSNILKQMVWTIRGTDFSRLKDWISVSLITILGYGGVNSVDTTFLRKFKYIMDKYMKLNYTIIFSSHSAGASIQLGLIDVLYKESITRKTVEPVLFSIKKVYAFSPAVSIIDRMTKDIEAFNPHKKSQIFIYVVRGDPIVLLVDWIDKHKVNVIDVEQKYPEEFFKVGEAHSIENFLSEQFINKYIDYNINMPPKKELQELMTKKEKAEVKRAVAEAKREEAEARRIEVKEKRDEARMKATEEGLMKAVNVPGLEGMFFSEPLISNKEKQTTTESKVKQAIAEKKFKTVEEKFAERTKREGNKDLAKGLINYGLSQGVDLAPKKYDTSTQEKYEAYEKVRKAGTLKKEMKDGKLQYVKEEQIGEDSHLILKFEPMRKDKMKSNMIQTVKKIAPKIPTPVGAKKETKIGKPKEKIVKKIQRVKKTFKIQ